MASAVARTLTSLVFLCASGASPMRAEPLSPLAQDRPRGQEHGFWSDVDKSKEPPMNSRFRGRVFIGQAVETNDARIDGAVQPWAGFPYANWAPRDSDLSVISSRGALAITGMSRSSDAVNAGKGIISTMGIGGFAIVDRPGSTGRGVYSDVQFEKDATYAYGYEAAVKNKGANATSTPYFLTTGTFGAYLVAGGDPSYGGAPANPSNTAVLIAKGGSTWNKGIVFGANAITGTDGKSGIGTAIELARGQMIEWRTPGNMQGAAIYSNVKSAGADAAIDFEDNEIRLKTNGVVRQSGGQIWKRRTIANGTDDTAQGGDMTIFWNSTAKGAKTEHLPACAAANDGQVYIIKDERGTAGSDPIKLVPSGGSIEGEASYAIAANKGVARLQCDGETTNWAAI